jgi:BMFP domain-containing protein YqiC
MAHNDGPQREDPSQTGGERIEVIIRAEQLSDLDPLDLDRLPDVDGQARVLVDARELSMLEKRGFDLEAVRRIPIGPLDPALVYQDDAAQEWLTSRLSDVPREREAD